jgi:carboxyl-terminal processing protease
MNREKVAWMVSIVLIGLLALQLPGTMAQRDDDYSFVRTLVDIHRQVSKNYVDGVNEEELRESAIDGMLGKLDPFSVYIPPAQQEDFDRMLDGSFKGVGIQLEQLDNGDIEVVTPIDGSPAFKAGVMAGDVILKVNGESVEGLKLDEVIKKIGGPLGTEVKLTVRHANDEEAELTMTREEIIVPTVKGYQRSPDNSWDYYICDDPKIAYLRITQFTQETFDTVNQILRKLLDDDMAGLILDLRFNPGGRLDQATQIVDLFLDEGVIVSTKGRNRPEEIKRATVPGTLPYFPMIVLVNEHSASASEIVAGSLMDNRRALVIGTRTFGKGSVQELIQLEGDSGELKLTVAHYYLPSGRLVHRKKDATDWGVEPQINVPMDAEQERAAMQARYEQELFRRPAPKATTQATTTQATTQAIDPQLQRAVDTMIALVVLQSDRPVAAPGEAPVVEEIITEEEAAPPATQPIEPTEEIIVPGSEPATAPAATQPGT